MKKRYLYAIVILAAAAVSNHSWQISQSEGPKQNIRTSGLAEAQKRPLQTMVGHKPRTNSEGQRETLQLYALLKQKALVSDDERAWLKQELNDPNVIEIVAEKLIHPPATNYKFESEQERLIAVDFLLEALDSYSESSPYIIEVVESAIAAENLSRTQDSLLRKSLMGDKIELFARLAALYPNRARNLHQRVRGTLIETILNQAMS